MLDQKPSERIFPFSIVHSPGSISYVFYHMDILLLARRDDCQHQPVQYRAADTRVEYFAIFEKLAFAITSRILRILMEDIEKSFS